MSDSFDEIQDQIDSDYEPQARIRKPDFAPKLKLKGPNSERAYWVQMTADKLNKPFNQILGITRDWHLEWIKDMYSICNQSDNFARLWWGLRKKQKLSTGGSKSVV